MVTKSINVEPRPVCLLCGSPGRLEHAGLQDRLFGAPGEWAMHRCENRRCGLCWLNPMPVAEDISVAYEGYYTHAAADENEAPAGGRWKQWLRRLHRVAMDLTSTTTARREALALYLDGVPTGRVLDVGAGEGRELLNLKKMGWKVEGQDVDPHAGAHSLNDSEIRVYSAPLEELHLPERRYDAIVMTHVIEHVHDPLALLRECLRLLAPGGQLVAVTPNSHSLGHRLFGVHWRALEPPRHLYLYSVGNLPRLAQQAGYSRAEVWTSAANAEGVGIASWNLLARGRHQAGVVPWGMARLAGLTFQIAASLVIKLWKSSGEEAIVRAWK
jgi:SAM-dependent methyltransferase